MGHFRSIWKAGILFFARAQGRPRSSLLQIGSIFIYFSLFAFLPARAAFTSSVQDTAKNISDADLGAALSAIDTLGRSRDEAAVELLAQAFSQEKRIVIRRALVDALGLLRFPSATPALTAALQDPQAQVRESAAVALEAVGDPRGDEALIAQASSEEDLGVKSHLIQILGRSKNPQALEQLQELAKEDDPQIKKMAQDELDKNQNKAESDEEK